MNKKLSGEYLADFNEVTKYLKKHAAKGEKLSEVLDDLSELYSDIEAEGSPLSSVHEGTAEDYAKELLENLPKKKPLFTTKRLVFLFAFLFAIFFFMEVFYDSAYRGINDVLKNPDSYIITRAQTKEAFYNIYKTNSGFTTGVTSDMESEFITITELDFSDPDKILIRGTAKSFYNKDGFGQIHIPAIYTYIYTPEAFLDLLSDFKEGDVRVVGDFNTGCKIFISHPERYGIEALYYGKPVDYKTNSDGDIDFEFVFEKTNSPYNNKSIEEYLSEGTEVEISFDCFSVKWNHKP